MIFEDEHERTSLLSSSTAPPNNTRLRPTLLHPYNPSNNNNNKTQQQQPHPYTKTNIRQTLTQSNIEEMERGAARLADDNSLHGLEDTDSVNGLLAGMEYNDDDESELSYIGDVGDTDTLVKSVSTQDLEYLTQAGNNSQQQRRRSSDGSNNGGDISSSTYVKKKTVDKIGNELLEAHDNKRLEQNILSRSLKLVVSPQELLDVPSEDQQEGEEMISKVHESTRKLRRVTSGGAGIRSMRSMMARPTSHPEIDQGSEEEFDKKKNRIPKYFTVQVISMMALMIFVILLLAMALALGTLAVGPPRQPLGEYQIVEAHEGENFWQYWDFYAGKDSAGSNGYINYVSEKVAREAGIVEVITEIVPKKSMVQIYAKDDSRFEEDWLAEDLAFLDQLKRQEVAENITEQLENTTKHESGKNGTISNSTSTVKKKKAESRHLQDISDDSPPPKLEPFNPDNTNNASSSAATETFVMISSSPTPDGPRNSVRLEGRRRFNRGLFIIDLRHMPAGCGTWPAFWLTDEANWPVNGEIDIVEGVNYQDTAKTALHTTKVCQMDDVPEGSKTGSWDTSVGIPNAKTGIPDMTFRWAQNCFVYDPHQWINQGCVATDLKLEGRSLGMPLNENGGGVYALEWDPVNRHIRTWIFSPHGRVPSNLRDALRTATSADIGSRVAPDTNQWGLPYGHFPIGK